MRLYTSRLLIEDQSNILIQTEQSVNKMQLALTGANGQLGKTIQQQWASAPISERYELHPFDKQLDITDFASLENKLSASGVSVIINAAAYTEVDGAEQDAEARRLAFAVNEDGPANLALWAKSSGARLIHLSTDFVFDGTASSPYREQDATNPLGVYGASKLAGELAVAKILPSDSVIVRASWLYSQYNKNFLKTTLRLMVEKDSLAVVNDQTGSPTSTSALTHFLFNIVCSEKGNGIYHFSDKGVISWYDFAVAIQEEGIKAGLLEKSIPISSISTAQYPTLATRPAYSVLDCTRAEADFACTTAPWREQLRQVIQCIQDRD
jgi:dTDP-4-dehydrorhamnose reductase